MSSNTYIPVSWYSVADALDSRASLLWLCPTLKYLGLSDHAILLEMRVRGTPLLEIVLSGDMYVRPPLCSKSAKYKGGGSSGRRTVKLGTSRIDRPMTQEMLEAAENLDFERAAHLRDEVEKMKKEIEKVF